MPATSPHHPPNLLPHMQPVPLDKAYRLMNHGPTVLVSATHGGVSNVMAAAWACVLDFTPPKVTVVLDKATATRGLIEASGAFALQLPTRAMAALTTAVGTDSARTVPDKLARHGVALFHAPGFDVPLVQGCVGWLLCKLVPEPHNQHTYDLFIGEVTAAWADDRVFSQGRWHFEQAADDLRTIHHVAGGSYLVSGEAVQG
jgi:flavin reductase (DIM6/NTAB) family NADH-FMN oxidoreductase RutF